MKKWLCFVFALAAVGLLTRLPHPAKDIGALEPVGVLYVYEEKELLFIETDTGDRGSGRTLTEAAEDLKARSDGEIFLETAAHLLLDPGVRVTPDYFRLLRPGCRVCVTGAPPDLTAAAQYLSVHPPEQKLRDLRIYAPEREGDES